jgi:hypothetical protein
MRRECAHSGPTGQSQLSEIFAMDLPQLDLSSAGELVTGAERLERLAARTDLNQGLRVSFRQLGDEASRRLEAAQTGLPRTELPGARVASSCRHATSAGYVPARQQSSRPRRSLRDRTKSFGSPLRPRRVRGQEKVARPKNVGTARARQLNAFIGSTTGPVSTACL